MRKKRGGGHAKRAKKKNKELTAGGQVITDDGDSLSMRFAGEHLLKEGNGGKKEETTMEREQDQWSTKMRFRSG